ncbi:uncharacterized protein FYW49_019209 [Xenentodon cancila]
MAQTTTGGTEQDCQLPPRLNGPDEAAENGTEGQEPADSSGGCPETQRGRTPVLCPGASPGGEADRDGAGPCVTVPGGIPGPCRVDSEGSRGLKPEQRGEGSAPRCPHTDCTKTESRDWGRAGNRATRPTTAEGGMAPDGEPLSRVDSEDSMGSTLMDMESIASSGRSTPAMLNGHGGGMTAALAGGKTLGYTCCWDQCQLLFSCSPDLAEHIRTCHVDSQRGGVFVCLWKGCKVYNTPSTSQSWLQRHMLSHSGDKPFKCVVGGCTATFASQGGLARHVPAHFSSQGSSKLSNQSRVKEESPSKAGLNKRRKLRNKYRRSLPRPHDFFDAQTMDAIRHRAICLNLATHIESLGNGHSVVFHSRVIARRKEDSGKVKVLLHWTPEDILPDVWVNESDRLQLKTKVVHLSKLPTDTAVQLDPNICRWYILALLLFVIIMNFYWSQPVRVVNFKYTAALNQDAATRQVSTITRTWGRDSQLSPRKDQGLQDLRRAPPLALNGHQIHIPEGYAGSGDDFFLWDYFKECLLSSTIIAIVIIVLVILVLIVLVILVIVVLIIVIVIIALRLLLGNNRADDVTRTAATTRLRAP